MRAIAALTTLGFLAACTSNVTVPTEPVIYEVVPQGGVSSTSGGALPVDATAGGVGGTPGLNPDGTPIGADRLNLNEFSLEQQKIDAALAERQLAEARSQLVVIQPSGVPVDPRGVNVALYAQQTTNPVGARVYNRSGRGFGSNCGRYASDGRCAAGLPRRRRADDRPARPRSGRRRLRLQMGSVALSRNSRSEATRRSGAGAAHSRRAARRRSGPGCRDASGGRARDPDRWR